MKINNAQGEKINPSTLEGQSIGIASGAYDVTPNDSANLSHPGWIQPRAKEGTIKFTDMLDQEHTWSFDQKEVSVCLVKKVFSTGTTADMGIVVYPYNS